MNERMPHDAVAESAVLGGILLNNGLISEAEQDLAASDFYLDGHRHLFEAMLDLHRQGTPIDEITLTDKLKSKGCPDHYSSITFLASLIDGVPRTDTNKHYIRIIQKHAKKRFVIRALNDVLNDLLENRCDADSAVQNILQEFRMRNTNELRAIEAVDLASQELPTDLLSLPLLGYEGYIIQGWSHLLAGYPKAGKTELLFDSAIEWARRGVRVLWLSEEGERVWQLRLVRCGNIPRGLELAFALGSRRDDLLLFASNSLAQVIIVDTVRNLFRLGSEIDNSEITQRLSAWEAALQEKTRIYVHHERKGGGAHGEGIAGGGAFLGVVDRAIELLRDSHANNRRRLVVHSRITEADDLVYERTVDGELRALGNPALLAVDEVSKRVFDVLMVDEWLKTQDVLELLGEPKVSLPQLRKALNKLIETGYVVRDPAEEKAGATYRYLLTGMEGGPEDKGDENKKNLPETIRDDRFRSGLAPHTLKRRESENLPETEVSNGFRSGLGSDEGVLA